MNGHTYLYRFYDEWFGLLYVGITTGIPTRFENHAKSKDWWPDVRHIDIERYDSRAEAMAAERRAIQKEGPWHNVQHGTAPAANRYSSMAGRERGPKQDVRHLLYVLEAWAITYASASRIFGVTRQAVSKWAASGVPMYRATDVSDLAEMTRALVALHGAEALPVLIRRPLTTAGDSILSIAEKGDIAAGKAALRTLFMRAA